MTRSSSVILVAIVLAWSVLRFVALAQSPPGFHPDEASLGVRLVCHEQGQGAEAVSRAYLYSGYVWVAVFGHSIGALRALSAVAATGAVVGVGFLGAVLAGPTAGLLSAFSIALSPWLFQFSRFANELPLGLACLVWGCFFALRVGRKREALVAGVLLALAGSTNALLLTQTLVLLALFCWKRWQGGVSQRPAFWILLSAWAVASLLLVSRVPTWTGPPRVFFDTFWSYFNPVYLMFYGDANLRHSTQTFGEASWVDVAALAGGALIFLSRLARNQPVFASSPEGERVRDALAVVALGGGAALAAAALKPVGAPSAASAIGALPFLAILIGVLLARLELRIPSAPLVLLTLAVAYSSAFFSVYLRNYPVDAQADWKPRPRLAAELAARTGDWPAFEEAARMLSPLPRRYYLIEYGGESCASSERLRSPTPEK